MSLNTFSGKAKFYHSRPTYPAECIDYLIQAYGLEENSVIADIGAGTGILSIPFLERGMTVFSVEPNSDMFEELLSCLKESNESRSYDLKDALHNIPVILAEGDKHSKKRIAREISFYRSKWNKHFLKSLIK